MAYGRAGIGRRVLAAALVTGLHAAAAGAQERSNGELQVGAWLTPGAFEAGVTGWVTDSLGLTALALSVGVHQLQAECSLTVYCSVTPNGGECWEWFTC